MNIYKPKKTEYDSIYSQFPDTQEELVEYLKDSLKYDENKLLYTEEVIKNIEWEEKELIFYIVPKGTPRPRSNNGHFYVKGAKEMKRMFDSFLKNENIICTRCDFTLYTWQPTPVNSMTNIEVILAEKGLIRPIVTPDFDNLAKTYTDALQGVLILNDNIINPGRVEKYYSIKPRIKIVLKYQKQYDCKYNERKTINSIGYKKMTMKGE